MKSEINISNRQQLLDRLSRQPSERIVDTAIVTSPGAATQTWAVKVKSNSSYNIYNVINIKINESGSEPTEIGQQVQAINLAEPFDQQGVLSAGMYVVMSRIGDKNIFYAEP